MACQLYYMARTRLHMRKVRMAEALFIESRRFVEISDAQSDEADARLQGFLPLVLRLLSKI